MAKIPMIDTTSVHDVQVARLDADMFNADDIDGVTESLTGSGNLNYLVLQSSQTNEAARNTNPFDFQGSDFNGDGMDIPSAINQIGELGDSRAINPSDFTNTDDSARGFLNTLNNHNGENRFSENNNDSFNNVNTISATHSSSSFLSSASESSVTNNTFPGDDGLDGLSGDDGNNGENGNGVNGENGGNGNDGKDGVSPNLPPSTPVHSEITIHAISDILGGNITLPIDPIGNLVGGVNLNVDTILGDILSTDDGLFPQPGAIIDGIIGDNHILQDLNVDPMISNAEGMVDDAVNALNPVLSSALPFIPGILDTVNGLVNGADGNSGIFVTSGFGLPAIAGMGGIGDLSLHIPTTMLDGILGTTNIHLDGSTDMSNLLTDGLNITPVDLGLLSTGDLLNGIDTGVTTGDLPGSLMGVMQDINGTLGNGDILGSVIPDSGNIPDNLLNSLTGTGAPATGILDDITAGNIFGSPDTSSLTDYTQNIADGLSEGGLDLGNVPDAVENLTGGDLPGADILAPVTDGVEGLLAGDVLPDPSSGLPDTVTGLIDGLGGGLPDGGDIPGGDVLTPIADGLSELLSSDIPDPSGIPDALAALPDTVTGLTDQIAGGNLLNDMLSGEGGDSGNGSGTGADTDLGVDTGLTVGDTALNSIDLGATLDPVENIVGDIDIGLNANIGETANQLLSGDAAGGLDTLLNSLNNAQSIDVSLLTPDPDQNAGVDLGVGDGDGLNGILSDSMNAGSSWPEATIGSLEAVTGGLGGAGDGGLPVTLPEPAGIITEGLNLISDTSHSSGGALGGLLGHHHGGGLFG